LFTSCSFYNLFSYSSKLPSICFLLIHSLSHKNSLFSHARFHIKSVHAGSTKESRLKNFRSEKSLQKNILLVRISNCGRIFPVKLALTLSSCSLSFMYYCVVCAWKWELVRSNVMECGWALGWIDSNYFIVREVMSGISNGKASTAHSHRLDTICCCRLLPRYYILVRLSYAITCFCFPLSSLNDTHSRLPLHKWKDFFSFLFHRLHLPHLNRWLFFKTTFTFCIIK
jgi:hypothetical protein